MKLEKQPVLVYRGKYIESTHTIHIAVSDAEGHLHYYFGTPDRPVFPRSSMKPFQAVPVIETGAADHFHFTEKELAICCASHNAEPFHQEAVFGILKKIGLPENALQCGTHPPYDQKSYIQLIQSGKKLTPVYSNCSGKHSGMLTQAVYMGEETETYREVSHPVQQRILTAVADSCDVPRDAIGLSVDGCGAPVHRLPLDHCALGYARLATGTGKHGQALGRLRDAMMAAPEMVGGTNRFDTDIMAAFPGKVVSKAGAEGVQCLADVVQGLGIAIKVEDGNGRPSGAAALEVLKQIGFFRPGESIPERLKDYEVPPIKNRREETIGQIKTNFTLIHA